MSGSGAPPYAVQPPAALAVLAADGRIVQASVNLDALVPGAAIGGTLPAALAASVARLGEGLAAGAVASTLLPPAAGLRAPPLRLISHRAAGRTVLELVHEPPEPSVPVPAEIPAAGSVFRLARAAAEAIAALTGFERVLVYRFHDDWSGEVIAERRPPDRTPYLGLRFPAGDIPPWARAGYLRRPVRAIADVDAAPLPILGDAEAAADLALASFAAVAPCHVTYCRNMGVRATLVGSLLLDGRLWGLVACHHRQPRQAGWALRAAFGATLHQLASRLAACHAAQRAATAERTATTLRRFTAVLAGPDGALRTSLRAALRHLGGSGVAVVAGQDVAALGACPPPAALAALAAAVLAAGPDDLFITDSIPQTFPALAGHAALASGVAALVIARTPPTVLLCLRPELVQEVNWAGTPDPARPDDSAAAPPLSPRASFALWQQTVRGRARAWEADVAALLPQALAALRPHLGQHAAAEIAALLASNQEPIDIDNDYLDLAMADVALKAPIDPDGRIRRLWASPAVRADFLIEPEEFAGAPAAALLRQLGLPERLDAGPLEAQEVEAWSVVHGSRHLRLQQVPVLRVRQGAREKHWQVLVVQDITDQRRLAEGIRAARDEALAASAAKSRFLAQVSHELRTPLNAILGFAELIANEALGPIGREKYRDFGGTILSAGEHLLGIVNGLVDSARAQSGQHVLSETVFDLSAAVTAAASWVERRALDKGQSLTLSVAPALHFHGDERVLRQVVINLLANAVTFTPRGGSVACRLDRLADGELLLRVSDTGVGIPPAELARVFEPFAQAPAAAAGSDPGRDAGLEPGLGLGLSLVKAFVELHGGSVSLTSNLGEGTTVYVALPGTRLRG